MGKASLCLPLAGDLSWLESPCIGELSISWQPVSSRLNGLLSSPKVYPLKNRSIFIELVGCFV
ncbi:MAG: hypothetical protein DSY50_04055 [Desulfobulbus sp.]|nr:MAG: hypothetical protein DSY50_04055 [Desulfobulbus sp.]RUM40887.1 MAG: hypothetical protein DSY70_02585 [Desulfobulbus sp.]